MQIKNIIDNEQENRVIKQINKQTTRALFTKTKSNYNISNRW